MATKDFEKYAKYLDEAPKEMTNQIDDLVYRGPFEKDANGIPHPKHNPNALKEWQEQERNRPRSRIQLLKKGGKVSSASKRADGIAQRGKTKGKYL